MNPLNLNDVTDFVEKEIGTFHQKKLDNLKKLKLETLLKKKNPYLFRAKNMVTAQDLVKAITDSFLSSQEETIFGDWLERLAIFINQKVFNGQKSSSEGIDLEFNRNSIHYIVSIKSGPNWGNSGQVKKMVQNFNSAQKRLKTSGGNVQVAAINGCCYGKDDTPIKEAGYEKLCGQRFWEFISGEKDLYLSIIEPLGHQAQQHNQDFEVEYIQVINKFTQELLNTFSDGQGNLDWAKIVAMNSGSKVASPSKVATTKKAKKNG